MMSPCDGVAERLACGEPLAELADHAEECPRCQGLFAAQRLLTQRSSNMGEPARGFTSRMTVMANQRLVTRHRRRVVGYAALSAAAAAMLTFALVRDPQKESPSAAARQPYETQPVAELPAGGNDQPSPWDAPNAEADAEEEARALLALARTYAAPVSADWDAIEKPLSAYRQLLRRVEHLSSTHDTGYRAVIGGE